RAPVAPRSARPWSMLARHRRCADVRSPQVELDEPAPELEPALALEGAPRKVPVELHPRGAASRSLTGRSNRSLWAAYDPVVATLAPNLHSFTWAEWADDPYPLYRRLRDEAPVYWDAANGVHVL